MAYDTFKYDVVATLGIISERIDHNGVGWTKEVNLVSWNGRDPKLDIREWTYNHEKMSKGLTLTDAEAEELAKVLHNYCRERSN
jgi:hypothetical protein